MIFYFSGTGNSSRIAKELSQLLNDVLIRIDVSLIKSDIPLIGEKVIFVCPVYAWGLPLYVEDFINRLPTPFFENIKYTYFILTCGDDIGYTDRLIQKIWNRHKGNIPQCFSVQMRNTYVGLPGFDIDSENTEKLKEKKAKSDLVQIAQRISENAPSTLEDLTSGIFPWIKSYILRPLFNKFLVTDRYFHVDKEQCIHCGKCVSLCALSNIKLNSEQIPTWKGECTQCFACYHGCPQHAINFGKYTKSKGQVKINF